MPPHLRTRWPSQGKDSTKTMAADVKLQTKVAISNLFRVKFYG